MSVRISIRGAEDWRRTQAEIRNVRGEMCGGYGAEIRNEAEDWSKWREDAKKGKLSASRIRVRSALTGHSLSEGCWLCSPSRVLDW